MLRSRSRDPGDSIADLDDAAAVVARLLSALERIEDLEKTAADLPAALEEARREAQASRDRAEQAERQVNEAREQLERVRDEIRPAEDTAEQAELLERIARLEETPAVDTPGRTSCRSASSGSSACRGALRRTSRPSCWSASRARAAPGRRDRRPRRARRRRRAGRGRAPRAGREDRGRPSATAPRRWRPPSSASSAALEPPSRTAPRADRGDLAGVGARAGTAEVDREARRRRGGRRGRPRGAARRDRAPARRARG